MWFGSGRRRGDCGCGEAEKLEDLPWGRGGNRGGGVCVGFLKRTRRRDKERYSKHILFLLLPKALSILLPFFLFFIFYLFF